MEQKEALNDILAQFVLPTQKVRFDGLGRRSRFVRAPKGKHLRTTARDVEILRWLFRYRYLTQPQLVKVLKPQSPKRLIERLGDLFHETGYINRLYIGANRFTDYASTPIYEITKSGHEYLVLLNKVPHRAVTFSWCRRRRFNPQWMHTSMIIDALLEAELETAIERDQRFVPIDEILARAPEATRNAPNPLSVPVTLKPNREYPCIRSRVETHLIPDGLYGIEYLTNGEKRYRFWALECERTTPPSRKTTKASSHQLKRAAYNALIGSRGYKQHWGIPNLKVNWQQNH